MATLQMYNYPSGTYSYVRAAYGIKKVDSAVEWSVLHLKGL